MKQCSKFIGLDTQQATLAIAVREKRSNLARYYGEMPNTPKTLAKGDTRVALLWGRTPVAMGSISNSQS